MRITVRVHSLSENIIIRKFMGALGRAKGFDVFEPFCILRKALYTAPAFYSNVFTVSDLLSDSQH